ncbi:MAG: hypothetical protein ABSG92_10330 [Conexivisphaerales archaeon]
MKSAVETRSWMPLRLSIAATLILLTIQGLTGNYVSIFGFTYPSGGVEQSISGFFKAVMNGGPYLILHAMVGIFILLLAVGVLVVSLLHSRIGVKIAAVLGLLFVISAGVGGYLFALSGFFAQGNTMEMGVSFIGAYAFYFITLWYTR